MSIAYNPFNGLLESDLIANVESFYTYNKYGEVESYTAQYSGTTIFHQFYTRDNIGRITRIDETVDGTTTVKEYEYDDAGRLHKVFENSVLISEYTYDANGNRTQQMTMNDSMTGYDIISAEYDDQDRLLRYGTTSYTYTANGDLLTKTDASGVTTYTYDNFGNLTAVALPNGDQVEYIIDAQNRRIGKKLNGAVVNRWLYQDQLNPVAELDAAGNVIARYVYGNRINIPEYIIKDNITYKVIADHLGSPRLVINSLNGEIAQSLTYDEYGNVLTNSGNEIIPFRFAGGLADEHTGLVRFGARDYSPALGRWVSKDPIGFAGGLSNLYEYCNNDPVNSTDISGLQPGDNWPNEEDAWEGFRPLWDAAGSVANDVSNALHDFSSSVVKNLPGHLDYISSGLTVAAFGGAIVGPFTDGGGFVFARGALVVATGLDAVSMGLSVIDAAFYGGSSETAVNSVVNFTLNYATGQAFRYLRYTSFGKNLTKKLTAALLIYFNLASKSAINEACPAK